MKIIRFRTLSGPNIYHHKPVIVMRLDLQGLYKRESNEFPDFVNRLLDMFPGLRQHHCAAGKPGGFITRLDEGTYFGHIVEHVALEMTERVGIPVNFGKTLSTDVPGCYDLIVRYESEDAMKELLKLAVEVVEGLLSHSEFDLNPRIQEIKKIAEAEALGPSTRSIVEAAEKRGVPWRRLDDQSLVQLGYGKNRRLIQATTSQFTSSVAVDIAADKDLTKSLLSAAWIPVPEGRRVRTEGGALEAFHELRKPLAVKPLDGHHGQGVSLNIETADELIQAFHLAKVHSHSVLVEEFFHGRDFRVLVIGGQLVAAAERIPPHVVGDGVHSIRELVDKENQNPKRGRGHENILTRLQLDAIASGHLRKSGRNFDSVPASGERVFLRQTANLSQGGTSTDVTAMVHPELRSICERAALTVGLDICGIDLVVPDITQPFSAGGIIEVNAGPGFRMHQYPTEGQPRDVAGAMIDSLYPPGQPSRIPIVAITGTNGKTTTTRMVAHILSSETGKVVGMTTSDNICIGGQIVKKGDTTGPVSARSVLADPRVEVAVLETARGGIMRGGLGYDWSDVGLITNVQLDHVGQDGIEDIDDILHVKSLVAERVREGGTIVLNADCEVLRKYSEEPRLRRMNRKVVLFSSSNDNLVVRRHLESGGTAFAVRDGWIVELNSDGEYQIAHVYDIPATYRGSADFQVANALASAAVCRSLSVPREHIALGLKTFQSELHNNGRLNFYRLPKGMAMVDYGHNPAAIEAVGRMLATWNVSRRTCVLSAPGDRKDDVIAGVGRQAARHFQRVIIKEDLDLRGRAPGETAGILARAAGETAEPRVILDEAQAVEHALSTMIEGELVAIFFEQREAVQAILNRYGAASITSSSAPWVAGTDLAQVSELTRQPDVAPGGASDERTAP
ncbi:MAG TPA: cyanophycin synthetase [Bdellovibrionales bacterium]|nr:cyanophycin synthetase [Bdellovibrionales bacterium]